MASLHFRRERVALDGIVFDAGTQIRVAINEQVVTEYAERMAAGVEFPPVVLFHDGVRYYLADGFHRTLSAKRNQFRDIDADVEVGTRADALWFALGANKANGQRLTEADKKQAIRMAIEAFPEKSQTMIADQVGVNQSSVQRVKAEVMRTHTLPDRVTGKDGKTYPASQAVRDKRRVETSKTAVHERRVRIRDMAGQGCSTRQIAAAVGISEDRVKDIARAEGINISADSIIGKTKRHDANRIIERMVMDAENLCADVNLIDFGTIDRACLASWLRSLQTSRDQLGAFIRRLMKEQQKHGKAA